MRRTGVQVGNFEKNSLEVPRSCSLGVAFSPLRGTNSFFGSIAGFQCHAIQNENQNCSIDEVQNLRKERR